MCAVAESLPGDFDRIRLKRWNELHYFRYAGRVDDATILFPGYAVDSTNHYM